MNYNAIKAQLVLQGKNLADLSNAIGISRSAMQRKMSGKSEFTRKEILKTIQFLGIRDPTPIFFDDKVS